MKSIYRATLVLVIAPSALAGEIVVPSGYSVELWSAETATGLEAVRNPAFGEGLLASRIDSGTMTIRRITGPGDEEPFYVEGSMPTFTRAPRIDWTGQFDGQLWATAIDSTSTEIRLISPDAQVAYSAQIGNATNHLSVTIEVVDDAHAYVPGAYLFDEDADAAGIDLWYISPALGAPQELAGDVNFPGRNCFDFGGIRFDRGGRYGHQMILAECDTNPDQMSAVYVLTPDHELVELVPNASTSTHRFWDLAFSLTGSFANQLYVLEGVSGEIQRLGPDGTRTTFASGLDIFAGGQITISEDGEHMWVAQADGIYHIARACVDLNGDGIVDGADLGLLLGNWAMPGLGDLDGNGTVDGADLGLLLGGWGPCS